MNLGGQAFAGGQVPNAEKAVAIWRLYFTSIYSDEGYVLIRKVREDAPFINHLFTPMSCVTT